MPLPAPARHAATALVLSTAALCGVTSMAAAEGFDQQMPVTLGAGLDHPLALSSTRAELVTSSGDSDLLLAHIQAERPWRQWQNGRQSFTLSPMGSLSAGQASRGRDDASLLAARGGLKLSAPLAEVPGLWLGGNISAQLQRFDGDNDVDLQAAISARYQARGSNIGHPVDFYTSLPVAAEGLSDTGLVVGFATPWANRSVGAEFASEGDRLNAFLNVPWRPTQRLGLVVGVADNTDLNVQLQWTQTL